MTRINLVAPSELTDNHLMAEYRELPRIFTAVKKLQEQGKTPGDIDISGSYVLGKGHCKFFYNKLRWLKWRYMSLYSTLVSRGFNLNEELYSSVIDSFYGLNLFWWGNYYPSPEEVYINMQRLTERHFK